MTWWLYPTYIVVLVARVYLSRKLGDFVDLLDKKTKISGAFLGGVRLAGVTSLPELFTSISSVLRVQNPSLVIGDILGSDIFDLTVLLILTLVFAKHFYQAKIDKFHITSLLILIGRYICALYAVFAPSNWQVRLGDINLRSLLALGLYVVALILQPKETDAEKEETDNTWSIKKIVTLFIIASVLLVGASIGITYLTDRICKEIPSLNGTVGGAVLLGVATSIPEIISTTQLFKKRNYNAGYGNRIGSCTFNYSVIAIADLISWHQIPGNEAVSERGIWILGDTPNGFSSTQWIVLFGLGVAVLTLGFVFLKNKTTAFKGIKTSFLFSALFAASAFTLYLLSLIL